MDDMRFLCSLACISLLGTTASADLIDFQGFGAPPAAFPGGVFGDFTLTASGATLIDGPGVLNPLVSRGLIQTAASTPMNLNIVRTDAGSFTLDSFEWGMDVGGTATLVGISEISSTGLGGGNEIFKDGTSVGSDLSMAVYSPSASFNGGGLTSVDISFSASDLGIFGLDNINLTQLGPSVGVPEPSSFAMLFAGGLGFFARRRRQKKAVA
jgi:hypothetical protein